MSARRPGFSPAHRIDLLVGQQQAVNLVMGVARAADRRGGRAVGAAANGERQPGDFVQRPGKWWNCPSTAATSRTLPSRRRDCASTWAAATPTSTSTACRSAPALFTMNGADITEPYNLNNKSGASNNTLGANDIAEAAVILNAYSAQYGRMAGGQVNFITKSGGNSFHGNLSESYNDAILNANDFFNNATGTPRGRSVANQYAAGLGGSHSQKQDRFLLQYRRAALCPALERSDFGAFAAIPGSTSSATSRRVRAALSGCLRPVQRAPGINRAVPVTTGNGLLQDSTGNLGCGKQKFPGTYVNGSSGPRFGVDVPCALAFGTNTSSVNTESSHLRPRGSRR